MYFFILVQIFGRGTELVRRITGIRPEAGHQGEQGQGESDNEKANGDFPEGDTEAGDGKGGKQVIHAGKEDCHNFFHYLHGDTSFFESARSKAFSIGKNRGEERRGYPGIPPAAKRAQRAGKWPQSQLVIKLSTADIIESTAVTSLIKTIRERADTRARRGRRKIKGIHSRAGERTLNTLHHLIG
ncbi:MAG: hypothetical protein DBY24_10430 [Prevotellaceae bacterium]|nr:MAG: hypothetical protein DBY24_10430 [Prevotellaceae bacterium]